MPIQDLRIDVDAHPAETGMPVIGFGHGIERPSLDLLFQKSLKLTEIRVIALFHKLVVAIHGGNEIGRRDLDDLRQLRQRICGKGAFGLKSTLEKGFVGGCGIADAPPLVDVLFMQDGESSLTIDALVATFHPEAIAQVVDVDVGPVLFRDERGPRTAEGDRRSLHPELLHIQERCIGTDVHSGQKNFSDASGPGLAGRLAGSPHGRVQAGVVAVTQLAVGGKAARGEDHGPFGVDEDFFVRRDVLDLRGAAGERAAQRLADADRRVGAPAPRSICRAALAGPAGRA